MYRRLWRLLRRVGRDHATPNLLRVRRIPDLWWNVLGYGLWAVGCLLFAIAAARDGDPVSLIAGLLFLVGILVVIGPLVRASRSERRSRD